MALLTPETENSIKIHKKAFQWIDPISDEIITDGCSLLNEVLKLMCPDVSPYHSGALSHLRKKNMAEKLFFVFAKIRVPLVCTYVYCTKWSRNISLIHVKVR
jgi:hypothetical protein